MCFSLEPAALRIRKSGKSFTRDEKSSTRSALFSVKQRSKSIRLKWSFLLKNWKSFVLIGLLHQEKPIKPLYCESLKKSNTSLHSSLDALPFDNDREKLFWYLSKITDKNWDVKWSDQLISSRINFFNDLTSIKFSTFSREDDTVLFPLKFKIVSFSILLWEATVKVSIMSRWQ